MQLRFTSSAERDLAGLTPSDASDVLKAIEVYANRGVGDVKKLKGYKPPTWRLRVGSFRVLYRRAEGSAIIVTAISNRRDVYRR